MKKLFLIFAIILTPFIYLTAQDMFDDIFDETESDQTDSGSNIEVSGAISTELVYYFDAAQALDTEVLIRPEAEVNLKIVEGDMEGVLSLNVSPQQLIDKYDTGITTDIITDIINELYLKAFFSFGYLEAGLMKVEWGSADGIHVLDPLSYWDLSDGYSLDIMNLKKSGELVKMNFYLGDSGLLEIAYKPFFSSHIMAQSGRWSIGTENIPNLVLPETKTLENSQVALRLTGNFDQFDIGVQYYYGYLPDPGITPVYISGDPLDPTNYTNYLTYNRAHLFGLEGGTSLGPFTFWLEAGYWLTEDTAGDDPSVYNNRLVYLPGVDFKIPGTNLYFNFQLMGDYTFKTDNLTVFDVDETTGYGTSSHNNMLLLAGEYSFLRDKFKIRLGGMWAIEEAGYMILPEFFWNINDNFTLSLYGQIVDGKTGNPGMMNSWKDNDSLSIKATYTF